MSHIRLPTFWVVPVLFVLMTWGWYQLYALDQAQSGTWGCEMSWMTPSYVKITTGDSALSRYALYLYRESGWDTEKEAIGHPVIFIPGNAGSYQQVRSIASSAARQYHGHPYMRAQDMGPVKKLDMYTLDLNEDFSAFHPQLVRDQAAYLAHAVHHIAGMYSQGTRITLVGHSMGGIVARLALQIGIEDMVDLVVTMSTPHQFAPITLDGDFDRIYNQINRGVSPGLINICGGAADTQIASDACALPMDANRGLTVFTSAIPGVWTGVDHQAMVWCHQVRWVVARLLLESTAADSLANKLEAARQRVLMGHGNVAEHGSRRRFETDGAVTFLLTASPTEVSACDRSGCQPLEHRIQPYPQPAVGSPFPLPGEGAKSDDMRYALTTNLTGTVSFDVAGLVELGNELHEKITARSWTPTSLHATHYRVEYPAFKSHSLLVHRLMVDFGPCSGPVPIVRYASDAGPNVIEERFHSADSPDALLHSHVARAPFVPSNGTRGMRLDIYQSPNCPVRSISVKLELWRSLAKAVHRYRMAGLAWSLGWSAVIIDMSLPRSQQDPAMPAWWSLASRHRIMHVLAGLVAVHASLAVAGTRLSAQALLGVDDTILSFVVLALLVWTLFLILSLYITLKAARTAMRQMCFPSDPASTHFSRAFALGFCAAFLGLGIWVPHELLVTLLVVIQLITLGAGASDLSVAILLFSLMLAPYDVARLIGWARSTVVDWNHGPRMTHNPLSSLPLLGLYILRCNTPSQNPTLLRVCSFSLQILAATSFLFGPRYTYILPWVARAAALTLCAILWPMSTTTTARL